MCVGRIELLLVLSQRRLQGERGGGQGGERERGGGQGGEREGGGGGGGGPFDH